MIKNIFRQIRLFSNARKEPYLQFHKVLGFYPDNIQYYQLAVHHKSVSILTENGKHLSNERLEFLGDAILNSVVTDILYRRYTDEQEGFLTSTRSKIVKRDSLNHFAKEIGLDRLMKVTKYVNDNTNNNIYGNAFEAIIGAIYLDYGYKKCKWFIENRLFKTLIDLDKLAEDEVNFKSKLIEWCQKYKLQSDFILVEEVLNGVNKHTFTTRLTIEKNVICEATGSSKKESQQNASQKALQLIQNNPAFLIEIQKATDKSNSESV